MARIGFVLVVSLFVPACRERPPDRPARTAVRTAVVERAAGDVSQRYSAEVQPASRIDLAFRVSGYVELIAKTTGVDGKARLLQEGDAVRAGAELARIRTTDYAQKVSEARAAVAQAKAAADQAELDEKRATALGATGAIAPAEVDSARIKHESTVASLEGARVRLSEAQTALADTSLRSPIDGLVLRRGIEVGTLAGAGTVGFTVADVGSVKAVFGVPDTVLPRVELGAAQIVTTAAFPRDEFAGRITRIAPSADPKSRVFEVEITIPNADGRLKSGMVAALALDRPGSAPAAAPLVPLASIVRSPAHAGGFAVFVVDGAEGAQVAHLREVELGEYLGRVIPVTRGLSGGERVIVDGAGLISEGEAVEVIP